MPTIEECLDLLDYSCVLILKANKGYSAVQLNPDEYFTHLLKEHHNAASVEKAMQRLCEAKEEPAED